mgnify:CR=1 FL=1
MKLIKLPNNLFTMVDDEDFEIINKFKWNCSTNRSKLPYVQRYTPFLNKKRSCIKLHRQIMSAKEGQYVDHINGNSLDNRKVNLRICTNKENSRNSRISRNNTSGYKGVIWNKRNKNWRARIGLEGKMFDLGSYKNKEDAAKAYNDGAIKYYGEYANLNIIKDSNARSE